MPTIGNLLAIENDFLLTILTNPTQNQNYVALEILFNCKFEQPDYKNCKYFANTLYITLLLP